MGKSESHVKLNSYYSTGMHYHRRNWLALFYFLLDAAVINSHVLYKLGSTDEKKLSHVEFQEAITTSLLREQGAVLRQRLPRPPKASCAFYTAPTQKESDRGHFWGELDSYRRCQVCHPPKKRGPPPKGRNALQELPVNAPNCAKDPKTAGHRTVNCCAKCSIPICYNSRCWDRHLLDV